MLLLFFLIFILYTFSFFRKSESRKFPSNIEVNNQNILGFVLANLNRPMRLHAIVLTCKLSKVSSMFFLNLSSMN